jgi:catechol 2,3-dioxygenase-like lactoylglutathione lyase family enzyme
MTSRPWPAILPVRNVRFARPTDQLDDVVRFYREGLGLAELGRFAGHAGYRGVLLGLPGMPYHLEFTQHDHGSPGPAPSRTNLLVLYFDDLTQVEQVASRLATLGHLPVEAENPYWTENGAVTIEDPDHWQVVLMPQPLARAVNAGTMIRLGVPADLPAASDVYRSASLSNAGDRDNLLAQPEYLVLGLKGWPRDAPMSRKNKGRLLALPPGWRPGAATNGKTCS